MQWKQKKFLKFVLINFLCVQGKVSRRQFPCSASGLHSINKLHKPKVNVCRSPTSLILCNALKISILIVNLKTDPCFENFDGLVGLGTSTNQKIVFHNQKIHFFLILYLPQFEREEKSYNGPS